MAASMRKLAKRIPLVLALGLLAAIAAAGTASAAPKLEGTFKIPGIGTNNKIVAGPDGNMWATTASVVGEDVVKIHPDGTFEMFELEKVLASATGITVGPGGTMWVVGGKQITSFSTSDPKNTSKTVEPPGLDGAEAIVTGPDGQLWVAAKGAVFHFAPANAATATEIKVPGLVGKDIDVAGSLLVIADKEAGRVVTLTTAGVEKDLTIPGGSQGLAGSASGQIAFSAPEAKPEQSGLITPPNPAQSFELTGDPFGVALGTDKAFWIVQFTTGVVERLTSSGAHAPGVSGLPKESARQIAAGPDNTLWVTLSKNENEGVAKIGGVDPEVVKPTEPKTTIAKGPAKVVRTFGKRAKVSFRFKSSIAGSKFECALTKLPQKKAKGKAKKAPKPIFKGCKSPRTFRLTPGSYRFWVRAVNAGTADATPAKQSFRVVKVQRPHKRHHK